MTSKIAWTNKSWNPVKGCSPGDNPIECKNCYARNQAGWLKGMGQSAYQDGFRPGCVETALKKPRRWRKGMMIFTVSMGDLFHRKIPSRYIRKVLDVIESCPQHIFQILTKRAERLKEFDYPANVWLGTSIGIQKSISRIPHLAETNAKVKWISAEPLLEPINFGSVLKKINWVVVGGESGRGSRPMKAEWAEDIRRQCGRAKVPFFFKQMGGCPKDPTEGKLNGVEYKNYPAGNVSQ